MVFAQEVIDLFIDALAAQANHNHDSDSWDALKSFSLVSHSFRRRAAEHMFNRLQTARKGFDLSTQIALTQELLCLIKTSSPFLSCMRVLRVDTALGTTPDSAIFDIMNFMIRQLGQSYGGEDLIHTLELCGDDWEEASQTIRDYILNMLKNVTGSVRSIRFLGIRNLSPLLLTQCARTVTELTVHKSRFLMHPTDFTPPSVRLKKLTIAHDLDNFMEVLQKHSAIVILSELQCLTLITDSVRPQEAQALGKLRSITPGTLRIREFQQKFDRA